MKSGMETRFFVVRAFLSYKFFKENGIYIFKQIYLILLIWRQIDCSFGFAYLL